MAALTPADVKRWDADAIHGVFQTATNRAATLQRLGDSLQQVHNTLSDWQGDRPAMPFARTWVRRGATSTLTARSPSR